MTQKTLCRFSKDVLKNNSSSLHKSLLILILIYTMYGAAVCSGAWLVCEYAFFPAAVLGWFGVRYILRIILSLSSAGRRTAVISDCLGLLSLPHGEFHTVRKRLRRLYFLRGVFRLLMRIAAFAVLAGGLFLLYLASRQNEGVYYIFSAAQAVPVFLLLAAVRFRMEAAFSGAETVCTMQPENSAWKSYAESCRMLRGQHLFLAALLIRKIPLLLLPVTQPDLVMTIVSFFSVRRLEWQYSRQEGADSSADEHTKIFCRYREADEAGGISPA